MNAATKHSDDRAAEFPSRLRASDALLWNIEKDPCLRSTIVAVSLLDRSPDWDRLRARMVEACDLVPRLRQHVHTPDGPFGQPIWRVDEFFDIDYHLRRVVAPEPGDLRAVLDLAAPIAMGTFDRGRPPWEFTLVEGLAGGQAAFVQKVHHSFTDGVGAIQLAERLFDRQRNPRRHDAAVADDAASNPESVIGTLVAQAGSVVGASVRATRALPGFIGRSITDPLGVVTAAVRDTRSVAKLLAPVSRPLSPIMTGRGMSRRLDSFDVPLDALVGAAHAAEGTLNDAFLAGIAGGMRLYHERHASPVSKLRVTMPISLRRPGDPPGGNRFAPARFVLPISTIDPRARMCELGDLARGWRNEPALPLSNAIAAGLNVLPIRATTSIFGSMLKAVDFVATNVPGLRHRAYLAGAEVVREYAFGPPSGASFSVALLSHLDQCCIGLNIDTRAVPDPDLLTMCIRDGFDEVLTVRGTS